MLQVPGDLHVHSCLSPCADVTMVPGEIARRLVARGVRIAALTDHNAACNAGAFRRVFERYGLLFIPGIEVTTSEEVHILCYFEETAALWGFAYELFRTYPRVLNDPERFGYQLVCNAQDDYTGQFPFLLSMASNLSLEQVCALVARQGGVAVPSHLDRRYGLLVQLGVVTPQMHFTTYEIAHKANLERVACQLPGSPQFISGSDAHSLDALGFPRCLFLVEEITAHEVLLALRREQGRGVCLL